jgi:hypothetical protein
MIEVQQSETTTRTLRHGERAPECLAEPLFLLADLDPDWVWIAEHNGAVVGTVVACGCHGIALILRVRMSENAPRTALLILLRRFFADLRERKCNGYMVWFDPTNESEKVLQVIAEKLGGIVVDRPGIGVASRLPAEGI